MARFLLHQRSKLCKGRSAWQWPLAPPTPVTGPLSSKVKVKTSHTCAHTPSSHTSLDDLRARHSVYCLVNLVEKIAADMYVACN
jgi:hypothetical protein